MNPLHSRSLLLILPLAGAACFNSDQDSSANADPFASSPSMGIEKVTNGFGRMLPHVVHFVDPLSGVVSPDQLVEIRSMDDLLNNRPSPANLVLPPAAWPLTPIVPSGKAGNHFVTVQFTRSLYKPGEPSTLKNSTVLDSTAAGLSNFGLSGAVQIVAYDPVTGLSQPVSGRAFINGWTYFGNPPVLERWVARDGNNHVKALTFTRSDGTTVTPGVGYPGTDIGILDGSFPEAGLYVRPNVLTFVADTTDDFLSSPIPGEVYETLPTDRVIRVIITTGVQSWDNRSLDDPGVATNVVGADLDVPLPLLDGVAGNAVVSPPDLSIGIPCDEEPHIFLSESCQPHSLGSLPANVPPSLSSEITVEFKPGVPPGEPDPGLKYQVPYTVLPVSPYDFTEFVITPVQPFPGSDPNGASAQAFLSYFLRAAMDLVGNQDPNTLDTVDWEFQISGECPGIVNVPVVPGAIYMASNGGGTTGGIRVLDLDGFGQGTGDPAHNYDDVRFDSGDISKFPFNPNVGSTQGQFMFPPLSHDNTTLAGGSSGVFSLAKDSRLSSQLVTSETVGTVADMLLGHPLDLLFNTGFCVSGANNCSATAYQQHLLPGPPRFAPGNSVSHAPHPNPPRIRLVPNCYSPLIQTEEPTFGEANGGFAFNLLVPGDAFGTLGGSPPTGLLTKFVSYSGFFGPQPATPSCYAAVGATGFTLRQQVGHLLYVLDTAADQVVVLNSNRMVVLDTISVADPRDMAIAPDNNLLAISNKGTNTVAFIDTNPNSPTFHTVIKTTTLVDSVNNRVGYAPGEIVWQPDNEDVLVVCEDSNSMAIISTSSLDVRKIIPGVSEPRKLAVTNRDTSYGFQTGLYYAYLVSSDGSGTIFESGPDGNQGIGFDTFIGIPSLTGQSGFTNASAIQPNPNSFYHSVFVAYRKNSSGAVADLQLTSAPFGTRNIVLNGFLPDPNFRAKEFSIVREYTGNLSSSSIVDIALDDLSNSGGIGNSTSVYNGSLTINHSSKSMYRFVGGAPITVSEPQFLFVAHSSGVLDVINLSTSQLYVNPIAVPGVQVLCHYWRQ